MNTFRNLLIVILTGLLALALSTQTSNGATVKTYDAVKLIQYDNCIKFYNNNIVGKGSSSLQGYPELFTFHLDMCQKYRP